MTDLAGTTNFLMLALIGLLSGRTYDARQVVLSAMVSIWSLRLGTFLVLRVVARKKDSRFDKIRRSLAKLLAFWLLQGTWVYVVSLPLTFVNGLHVASKPITALDRVGWAVWAVGFALEAAADYQRHAFNRESRRNPRGKPFLDTGLWRYSRHPNYFGDIVLWLGISISAANGLWPYEPVKAVLLLASPAMTIVFLVFVSGMPIAEAREDRRNHRYMAYKQYKHRTSPLIPLSPAFYAGLSPWVKKWLFLDRYQLAFITVRNSFSRAT